MNKEQNMIAAQAHAQVQAKAQNAEMGEKELGEKELENVCGGGLWNIFLPRTLLDR